MKRAPRILLVEDNPGDAELIRELLTGYRPEIDLYAVPDGRAALSLLRREAPYVDVAEPDLVLLDLNLPKMDGREVLATVRAEPALAHIPVIILSSSDAPRDIRDAYVRGASCYLQKPVGLDALQALLEGLAAFWLGHVKLS